jgi:multidrug resistance efflux pump
VDIDQERFAQYQAAQAQRLSHIETQMSSHTAMLAELSEKVRKPDIQKWFALVITGLLIPLGIIAFSLTHKDLERLEQTFHRHASEPSHLRAGTALAELRAKLEVVEEQLGNIQSESRARMSDMQSNILALMNSRFQAIENKIDDVRDTLRLSIQPRSFHPEVPPSER